LKCGPDSVAKPGQIALCLLAFICCPRILADDVDISKLPPPATNQIDFASDIRPILETSCIRCHGPEKPKSRFRLDNREAALKGGEEGVDILPGHSAKSSLILYTAYLVQDSEMPPIGKGRQLTAQQVSLLRAWIDQGVVWNNSTLTTNLDLDLDFPPVLGGATLILGDTKVSGDKQKFREHYWQKDGVNGGVEQFELFQQTGSDTTFLLTGHALVDDYKIVLSIDENDIGFIHSGFEQYRKYFDDTGGYAPSLVQTTPSLGEDLHLDIGKAWVDFGLTLPDWPRLVLGYEYDYRQGNEASAEWGAVGTVNGTARNIAPASTSVNESVNIIKFDLDDEIKGVSVEERFRGEFYKLDTGSTNTIFSLTPQNVSEGTTYFQGANTIRLEKSFTDWLFGSAGYLYSKLDADSAFRMDEPTLLQITTVPQIALERESHVGNLNIIFGPNDGLTISTGAQAEWTRQHGFGGGIFDEQIPTTPITDFLVPFNVASDYDETSLQENMALRYSKIPFTSLFAEARLEQQDIGQYDQFSAAQNILNKAVFLQHTDFSSQSSDLRFGFDTSPWRSVSFNAHYRRYKEDDQYDSGPLVQPTKTAYPTFINSRSLLTDEVEAKLVLHPSPLFKTTLSYQYQADTYGLDTRSYVSFGNVISPGGQLIAGEDHSHTFSINATLVPTPRLFLSTTFSYEISSLVTAADGSPTVVPYCGDIYTVLANGTYVFSQTTDLFAGYAFSEADYGQNNFAGGQPLGIQYQQHGIQVGISRKFSKNISTKLQYRLDYYDEPSSGGANNYRAQSIFGTLAFQF
jgi:hypothetical protein